MYFTWVFYRYLRLIPQLAGLAGDKGILISWFIIIILIECYPIYAPKSPEVGSPLQA